MNCVELTATITALANAAARELTDDELTILGSALTQLADTLFTIAACRSLCNSNGTN